LSRLLLALCALAVPLTQWRIDRLFGGFRAQHEALYLWSGADVRRLAPGLENLMADVYWLRTVQYYGGQRAFAGGKDYALLRPLIEITVTLDPRLEIAYRYGAIFMAEPPPLGAGRPRDAIALLERGVAALPRNWALRQDLGFYHFIFLKQPHEASRILLEAAGLEGAPGWFRTLAASVLARGGDRATARLMWAAIYEQSDGHMKANAKNHLQMLDALDAADRLTRLVAEHAWRSGRAPAALAELVHSGALQRPPVDSSGVPFDYDPLTGKVSVSRRSRLWRPSL
jgi:hypothetical protein